MALQARAEATRSRIIESAVDLFGELGYGETGLADILARASVSKGAFYYHFDSKEAVAEAIIDDFRNRSLVVVLGKIGEAPPDLDGIIQATFASSAFMQTDKTAKVGNQLVQALTQISGAGSRTYGDWTAEFVAVIEKAIQTCDLRADLDAADIAETVWAGMLGCQLLSSAIGDDPFARLARTWRVLLTPIVAEDSRAHFHDLLDRQAHSYAS
jgi:AcrR family transcriptional regulator